MMREKRIETKRKQKQGARGWLVRRRGKDNSDGWQSWSSNWELVEEGGGEQEGRWRGVVEQEG